MANGTDSEEFVVLSKVRSGLKREFAFALKYQSQISGSGGRTRARKIQSGGLGNAVSEKSSNKKLKTADSKQRSIDDELENGVERLVSDAAVRDEEEGNGDVVDLMGEDEPKNHVVESENGEELKGEIVRHEEEEPKSNAIALMEAMSDDEPKSNLVESPTVEDLKDDAIEPVQDATEPMHEGETMVEQVNTEKSSINEESKNDKVETPCEVGISEEFPIVAESPFKRVTRSALKPKAKPTEISTDVEVTEALAEGVGGEEDGLGCSSLVTPPPKKAEIVSRLNALKKFPTKLKDFLDTGILEGLAVKYVRGSKSRGFSASGLQGVIKGSGILCLCKDCKGKEVVSPNQFELHAGSSNKRPPEYIYLENGNTLRDVMNACRNASPDKLEETFQMATGCSSVKMSNICLYCRGSIPEAGSAKCKLICNLCDDLKDQDLQTNATQITQTDIAGDRSPKSVSVPKFSKNMSNCGSSRSKSQGRITRKDLRLHKLVFEEDFLPDGTEVAYYVRAQKLLVGYKQGSGIFCSCCKSEISPSQFEAHAGFAARRKPFHHIFISSGASLHELAVALSKGRKFSTKDNDDRCTICSDYGNLMCCDGCPRAFHKECVSLPAIPTGKWYCKTCQNNQKEKFEHTANAIAAGRVAGIDPLEQITQRCFRMVTTPGFDVGGCVLCRSHDFSKSKFGPRTVMLCDQCEKEYHVGCLRDHKMQDLKELPEGIWFCCSDCKKIHCTLDSLIIHGEEDLSDSFMDVIKQKHDEVNTDSVANPDIKWRLIRGKSASDENKILLSKAVVIFRERFGLIPDSTSSRDLIPAMVYGRRIRDRDFGGMYCAILTVNSVVVSAGILRIFGPELAELPLVATSNDQQGKGYFQSLFSCIEGLLGSVNVRNLVVPAADEAESIWTSKFGFDKMSKDELNKYSKHHDLMTFQEISWLKKLVPPCPTVS